MAHHGDAGADDQAHALDDLLAALELDGLGAALLHDAHGVGVCVERAALIGAEGHVAHHEGALDAVGDAAGVIYHLVESDGQCGGVAGHDIRRRVADEYGIDSGGVDKTCHRVVVGCEHGYLLTLCLELGKAARGDLAGIFYSVGRHIFMGI